MHVLVCWALCQLPEQLQAEKADWLMVLVHVARHLLMPAPGERWCPRGGGRKHLMVEGQNQTEHQAPAQTTS